MRPERPRGTPAPIRFLRTTAGVAILGVIALCRPPDLHAQPGVEEPDWNQTGENAPVTLDEDLSHAPADSLPTTASPGSPSASVPNRPAGRSTDILNANSSIQQDRAIQELQASTMEPFVEDPDFGVPDGDNWELPGLQAADPFFQMEGLKIRLGEVHIRLSMNMSFEYNDNIFQTNTQRIGDYITRFTPVFLIGAGDFRDKIENYFSLAYSPQPEFYAENSNLNTVNEFLSGSGQYAFSRYVTTLSVAYRRDSNPNEDQIGIRENTEYAVNWGHSYALGAKTFLEGALSAEYSDLNYSVDYTTVSVSTSLAYEYSPKTRFSFGPLAGITFVDGGGEQPFQGLTFGFNHNTLRKISFGGNIGVQARQFRGPNPSGQTDYITPTFGLNAAYQISQTANVSLDLSRIVQNSGIIRGQSVITNEIGLRFNQRLFGRIAFDLSIRYNLLEYQGTGTNHRTDTYFSGSPSIGYEFWNGNCVTSVFYERRQRGSEIEAREFYSNTFGTRLEFKF